MKKTESKNKKAMMPDLKPSPLRLDNPSVIEAEKRLDKMGGSPTPEQLATIAATLARNTNDTPNALVDCAMKLWLAARARIFNAENECEMFVENLNLKLAYASKLASESNVQFAGIMAKHPLTRDRFLKTMLPQYKGRADKLAQIGKAYVHDSLRESNGRLPTQNEVAEAYGNWKPYKNDFQANHGAKRFERWHSRYLNEVRRAAGEKSAAKKKMKKKL